MFLPPETRKALIELALAEAGLANRVEVAFYPEIYNTKGFQGVIGEIKRRYPGARLHTPARHGFRRHAGPPDQRRMRLDLSVAHPAPRQGFGDGDPQGRQGHDVAGRDRRAFTDLDRIFRW